MRAYRPLLLSFGSCLVLLAACLLMAQETAYWHPQTLAKFRSLLKESQISGSALVPGTAARLFTWGDRLTLWDLSKTSKNDATLYKPKTPFGAGGCVFDLDQDGQPDLVLQQGRGLGQLVWLKAPDYEPHVIDTDVEFQDCLGTTLNGRRGILVVHRFMQVRFYEIPAKLTDPWPMQELYSFYTASKQGGLLQADVNGDGRLDLLCGNYWINSPAQPELPWHLFAINTHNETPESAFFRLALAKLSGGAALDLVASQGNLPDAELLWYTHPDDPAQLWPEHKLGTELKLQFPRGLVTADLNGDGRPDIVVGEDNGQASRLIVFWNQGGGQFSSQVIGNDGPVLDVYALPDGTLLNVSRLGLTQWTYLRK